MSNDSAIQFAIEHKDAIRQELARRKFQNYVKEVKPNIIFSQFHTTYYRLLNMFAHGQIKRMIVSVPPQTGKTEGATRLLPSYLLGCNPDLKIAICSYSQNMGRDFNRDVQKIIDSKAYQEIFPSTKLFGMTDELTAAYIRNSDLFEIVGHNGSLRVVGRGGGLTGKTVDVVILDDVYKDYAEANSPLVREQAWKWYTTVVRTRLHNDSQEMIVFTRWHEDDIIGKIEQSGERILDLQKWSELDTIDSDTWVRINFEAIKTTEPSEIDPREIGTALWEERHSLKKLLAQRALDPVQFNCLYQGNPMSAEGRLYQPFKIWSEREEYGTLIRRGCMVDVADKGTDYLCAVSYDVVMSPNKVYNEQTNKFDPLLYALVTDIEYTQDGTEITEITVPQLINRNSTKKAWIESNNGGSQFSRKVSTKVKAMVESFYQSSNKESKIVTNAASVNAHIIFPMGWETRYPIFYKAVTTFLRSFDSNKNDDAPDCLTEIYLKEISTNNTKAYQHQHRGIKRIN